MEFKASSFNSNLEGFFNSSIAKHAESLQAEKKLMPKTVSAVFHDVFRLKVEYS